MQCSIAIESVQNLETHDSASRAFFTTAFNLTASTAAVNSSRGIDTAVAACYHYAFDMRDPGVCDVIDD